MDETTGPNIQKVDDKIILTLKGGKTETFVRSEYQNRLGITIGSIETVITQDIIPKENPFTIQKYLQGKCFLPTDFVEIIGYPETRTNELNISIHLYAEVDRKLSLYTLYEQDTQEDSIKPTVFLSYTDKEWEFGIDSKWSLFLYLPNDVFIQIEECFHSLDIESISFNLDMINEYRGNSHNTHYYIGNDKSSKYIKGNITNIFLYSKKYILPYYREKLNEVNPSKERTNVFEPLIRSIDRKLNVLTTRLTWLFGGLIVLGIIVLLRI